MSASTSAARRVHPLVRLAFLLRVASFPLVALMLASLLWERGAGAPLWVALALTGLVVPHVYYRIALGRSDPRRAEHWNLRVDSLLAGLWSGLIGFALWPTTVLMAIYNMVNLSLGGLRFGLQGAVAIATGAVTGFLLQGMRVEPHAGAITVGLSVALLIYFPSLFGLQSFAQARRLIATRRLAEQQREEIVRQQSLLEEAKDAAEQASRAKSAFLASMSHELRTPLNAVIGYSEMLEEEVTEAGQSEFVPDLRKIRAAGKHLLHLINSVLDLSKVEAGKMDVHLETAELEPLLEEVTSTVEPLVRERNNTLHVRIAPGLGSMSVDPVKLRQVLLNLLSNACKFTEHGTVTLTADRGDGWATFAVTDTGIGMTPDQQQRLFTAFSQADSEISRKYGGTGLGLALSRRFCQLMGGDVTVDSAAGEGSTFTVRLPIRQVASRPSRRTGIVPVGATTAGTMRAMRRSSGAIVRTDAPAVLVIDDDPMVQDLMEWGLERAGFRVTAAGSISDGLRLAREQTFALVTLEVEMTDGWDALQRLTHAPAFKHVPVVVVSVDADLERARALGAIDCLVKPIDRERLVTLLEQYRRRLTFPSTDVP